MPLPIEANAIKAIEEFGTKILAPAIPVAILTSVFGSGVFVGYLRIQEKIMMRKARKEIQSRHLEERTGEEGLEHPPQL